MGNFLELKSTSPAPKLMKVIIECDLTCQGGRQKKTSIDSYLYHTLQVATYDTSNTFVEPYVLYSQTVLYMLVAQVLLVADCVCVRWRKKAVVKSLTFFTRRTDGPPGRRHVKQWLMQEVENEE